MGTYVHGLFDSPETTQALLQWLAPNIQLTQQLDLNQHREQQLNKLADVCRQHLDINKIKHLVGLE